jgi:heme oxygenase
MSITTRAYRLDRLLTETQGVHDGLDKLYLRMDSRGDAAHDFLKVVGRLRGEVKQLTMRIRQIQELKS